MKVFVRTPTELIIRDSAMTLRLFGAFLVAFGAFVIWLGVTQEAGGRVAMFPTVLGAVLAAGGALLIVLPSRKTFAFSKTERVFVIATQRFGRVERQTFALRDVADVSLEESKSDDSGSTYRVVITLVDQRRVPWTSYYTSGYAAKRAVVDVARDFLELEPVPALGSGGPTSATERSARGGRIGLTFIGAFCCLFLGLGVHMLMKEQRRLTAFQPIEATVLSTRVEEHSDSDGSTYQPVVVYRYRVDDREYTSSRVTPLNESRSGRWADGIIARYSVGSSYTAYYDPANPGDAYLLRSRSIIPWAFVAIPAVGLAFIVVGFSGRQVPGMSRRPRS